MIETIYQIRNDNLFHDLINQDNMNVIEWIVMTILDLKYLDVHNKCVVKNSRLTRISKKDKNRYVDLIISYKEYEIILELNNWFLGSLIRNIVYGMTRIVNYYQIERNKKKDYYKENLKVIVINLNWCHKNRKSKLKLKRIDKVFGFDDIRKGIFFEVINVSLDSYAEIAYNKIDTKEKFYKLLTINKTSELLEFTKNEELLKEYASKLIEFSKDEKYMEEIMTETMERNLREFEIYTFGEETGIEQTQKEMIIRMYKDNITLTKLAEYANLSVAEVKKIINESIKTNFK